MDIATTHTLAEIAAYARDAAERLGELAAARLSVLRAVIISTAAMGRVDDSREAAAASLDSLGAMLAETAPAWPLHGASPAESARLVRVAGESHNDDDDMAKELRTWAREIDEIVAEEAA